jgi:DUF2075 family protein/DNA replication protein DnaC
MKQPEFDITFDIISDRFPPTENIKEYEKHCVTYLIHNNEQIYIGETANLRSRIKDHQKVKEKFKFVNTKIIISDYFNKSAIYDIESRLINYIYADNKYELINIKKDQSSHNYYLKNEVNEQLFKKIWNRLKNLEIVKNDLGELENNYLFKYSPFKEFSENQLETINEIIQTITDKTEIEDIGFDGSTINLRKISNKKNKILVKGGPGTGKTLLIVKLVHDLTKKYGIDASEITVCIPQGSLLKTFKTMFRQAKLKVKLVKPVELSRAKNQQYNLLIVDEAHRLKQHFNKQSKDLKHLAGGKVTELDLAISKSKNLILMFDDQQRVRPADINVKDLNKSAFQEFELAQQFRVKNGANYLRFLKAILQISHHKPSSKDLNEYDFKIFDNINEMYRQIKEKETEFGLCRLASGYFKKWISKNDPKKYDFEEEGLKLKWNTNITSWIHTPESKNEVGCIHTLQGEDLNYAGIIIGNEIYYDPKDQKIKINPKNYFDQNGTPINGTDEENAQLTDLIKNIYYVLLSRGMRGTYLYVKDEPLRKYFKEILKA